MITLTRDHTSVHRMQSRNSVTEQLVHVTLKRCQISHGKFMANKSVVSCTLHLYSFSVHEFFFSDSLQSTATSSLDAQFLFLSLRSSSRLVWPLSGWQLCNVKIKEVCSNEEYDLLRIHLVRVATVVSRNPSLIWLFAKYSFVVVQGQKYEAPSENRIR